MDALTRDGWEVTAASRRGGDPGGRPGETRTIAVDRDEEGALEQALGDGCDLLVDVVAFGAPHARQLTALSGRVGSAVVVSTGALYTDARGRGFDTQGEPDGAPVYPVPIPESQPTVPPGDGTYASRKAELERTLLDAGADLPVTLLRAGAIHGPYSRSPRELYFVKRLLDGRRRRVLAFGGTSVFHPAHVANLAELVRLAALRPGSRVLNAADPDAPSVAEIGAAIDEVLGTDTETVLMPGPPGPDGVGDTPWSIEHPVVYDMSAAERELGYRAVTGYAGSLPATVSGLVGELEGRDWREAFPDLHRAYGPGLFDYAAEDAWLKRHDRRG